MACRFGFTFAILAALLAAQSRRFLLMGLLLGCAIATKQHALLAVPLIVVWATVRGADVRTIVRSAVVGTAVVAAFLLPFVVWDATAFVRDTIVFLIGSGTSKLKFDVCTLFSRIPFHKISVCPNAPPRMETPLCTPPGARCRRSIEESRCSRSASEPGMVPSGSIDGSLSRG